MKLQKAIQFEQRTMFSSTTLEELPQKISVLKLLKLKNRKKNDFMVAKSFTGFVSVSR